MVGVVGRSVRWLSGGREPPDDRGGVWWCVGWRRKGGRGDTTLGWEWGIEDGERGAMMVSGRVIVGHGTRDERKREKKLKGV